MSAIVPAILPKSRLDLEEKLERLRDIEGVDSVQIDVVDGRYATPATWPYKGNETVQPGDSIHQSGRAKYEIDLMVSHPEEAVATWVALGASRITLHIESTKYLSKLLDDMCDTFGHDKDFSVGMLSIGIAIGIETDLSVLEPYVSRIDYVQFMGIKTIGRQGEPFDSRVLKKIAAFRKLHPDMEIQVDGGVSRTTAPELLKAGVDRLIVGSALMNAKDLKQEFDAFTELTEEHGIYE